MSTRNEPTGIIWHDDEQPLATYPEMPAEECGKCGCACDFPYCKRCIRDMSIAREQELRNYWHRKAVEREERFSRYGHIGNL